jgi:hypothetical protein
MGAAAAQAKNHLATVLNLSRVARLSEQRRNQRLGSPKPFVGEDHRFVTLRTPRRTRFFGVIEAR